MRLSGKGGEGDEVDRGRLGDTRLFKSGLVTRHG